MTSSHSTECKVRSAVDLTTYRKLQHAGVFAGLEQLLELNIESLFFLAQVVEVQCSAGSTASLKSYSLMVASDLIKNSKQALMPAVLKICHYL